MSTENKLLIQAIKDGIYREQERIERAQREILKMKLSLLELGVEFPLEESEPNRVSETLPQRLGFAINMAHMTGNSTLIRELERVDVEVGNLIRANAQAKSRAS